MKELKYYLPLIFTIAFIIVFDSQEAVSTPMDPTYVVIELDVYQSGTDTLDDGTAICTNVNIDSAGTCSGTLLASTQYQFEFTVRNDGSGNGEPDNMEFRLSVGGSDVLGTTPTLGNGGCEDKNNWTMSIVTTRVDGDGGTTCNITASGGIKEFYMIITTDSDVCSGTATATFFIDDGSFTDESATITFNCGTGGSPVVNIDQYDIYESDSTTLGSGIAICTGVDADTAGQNCSGTLFVDRIYRIEFEVDETAGNNFTPTTFDLDVAVGNFDVLGDVDFVGASNYILNSGCEDHTDWTESFVGGTDVRSTAGTTTNCVINSGADASDEFWIIIKIHTVSGRFFLPEKFQWL